MRLVRPLVPVLLLVSLGLLLPACGKKDSSGGDSASPGKGDGKTDSKPSDAPKGDPCTSEKNEAGGKILRLYPLKTTSFGGLKVPGFEKSDGRIVTESPILLDMNLFRLDDPTAYVCAVKQQATTDGWKVESIKDGHIEVSKAGKRVEVLAEPGGSSVVKMKVSVSPRK